MTWLGDFAPTAVTVQHKFTTVNASGVPTTLGDSPTLRLYVNASVSGVASGITLTTDFDSITGLNHVSFLVTTSVTGVTSGTQCQIVIATGSVSGVSLKGYPLCEFSLKGRALQSIASSVISWPTFDSSTKVNGRLDTNIGTIASVTVIGSGSSAALWRGF